MVKKDPIIELLKSRKYLSNKMNDKVKMVPELIDALIKIKNIPKRDLENEMKVPHGYLDNIITGKIKSMTLERLLVLLGYCEVSFEDYISMLTQTLDILSNSDLSPEKRRQTLNLLVLSKYPIRDKQKEEMGK